MKKKRTEKPISRFDKLTCWIFYGHSAKPEGQDVWTCIYCGKTLYSKR